MLSHFSCVRVCTTLWDHKPLVSPARGASQVGTLERVAGDMLDSGTEPMSLTSPALAGRFLTTSAT